MSGVLGISLQEEYNKHSDIKPEDIQNIREWLNKQPHLPHEYITDLELICAYHSCDRNMDVTKRIIDLNYTLRSLFTFYQNRVVNNALEKAFNTWLLTPISVPTLKGYRAVYCQLLDVDVNNFVYTDAVRAFVMMVDLWQFEEGTFPGVTLILNMDKVSLSHMSRIDLKVAQQFFYFLQEAMFVRLKEFHFLNAPSYIDTLLTMVKPFMKRDMLDILKVHKVDTNTIYDYIPKSALPKGIGGDNKDADILKCRIWNKIKENEKFFDDESKKRVNESKRPGKPKDLSTFFGSIENNFKNLEID